MQFLNGMDLQLGELGAQVCPRVGENRLIEEAKQGKFNFSMIVARLDEAHSNTPSAEIEDLTQKAKKHLRASADKVVRMRSQVENLADYLLEAADHVANHRLDLLKDTLADVVEICSSMSEASGVAHDEFTKEEAEFLAKYKDQLERKESCQYWAGNCRTGRNVSGTLSALSALGAAPAAWGVATFGSSAARSAAAGAALTICPVTLAIGLIGAASFGLTALLLSSRAESHEMKAETANDMAAIMQNMKQVASYNESLWMGVRMSAEELARELALLQKVDPEREKQFKRKTEKVANSLRVFVSALDGYLVWLSLCKYFPPNYDLQSRLGRKRYVQLLDEVRDRD